MSTTGAWCHEERCRNSAPSAIDAANEPMIAGDVQPQPLPCTIPGGSRDGGGGSTRAPVGWGSGGGRGGRLATGGRDASTTRAARIGTFTRKQSRQSEAWISRPPIGGPSAAAIAAD